MTRSSPASPSVEEQSRKSPAPAAAVSNHPAAAGTLWVVATPIGHMGDLSPRAAEILGAVDWVAAEDTRRTGRLLADIGARPRRFSLHEHNEASRVPRLLRLLAAGRSGAVVSDAGTPLLSDPGWRLVRAAADAGVPVAPVPGPSSIAAALSVAGLEADRFVFDGFLPAREAARRKRLAELAAEPRTVVAFEAPHRIVAALTDLAEALGADRRVALARELTKVHETVLRGSAQEVLERVAAEPEQQLGEMVLVVAGAPEPDPDAEAGAADGTLRALLEEGIAVKQAARIAARLTGARRNALYQRALELREGG